MAPEELHQLPHAARGGRLLCARPDQDCPAPRRGVSPAVPSRSVEVLLRGAARPADAEPEALRRPDQRGHRVSDLGLQYRQSELAATADPRHRGVATGDRARHAGARRRLGGSGGARRGGLQADATGVFRLSRTAAGRHAGRPVAGRTGDARATRCSEVPTTKAQRKRRRSTSGSRSSTRMATSCRGRPSRWAGNRSCRPSRRF